MRNTESYIMGCGPAALPMCQGKDNDSSLVIKITIFINIMFIKSTKNH